MSVHEAPNPDELATHLSQSFEKTLEQNRKLAAEVARFTRDETTRFVHLRLGRTGEAFSHFQGKDGVPALVQVQQAWLRDLVKDYTDQSLRYAGLVRTLATNLTAAARETGQQMVADSREIARETQHDLQEAGAAAAHAAETATNGHNGHAHAMDNPPAG